MQFQGLWTLFCCFVIDPMWLSIWFILMNIFWPGFRSLSNLFYSNKKHNIIACFSVDCLVRAFFPSLAFLRASALWRVLQSVLGSGCGLMFMLSPLIPYLSYLRSVLYSLMHGFSIFFVCGWWLRLFSYLASNDLGVPCALWCLGQTGGCFLCLCPTIQAFLRVLQGDQNYNSTPQRLQFFCGGHAWPIGVLCFFSHTLAELLHFGSTLDYGLGAALGSSIQYQSYGHGILCRAGRLPLVLLISRVGQIFSLFQETIFQHSFLVQ